MSHLTIAVLSAWLWHTATGLVAYSSRTQGNFSDTVRDLETRPLNEDKRPEEPVQTNSLSTHGNVSENITDSKTLNGGHKNVTSGHSRRRASSSEIRAHITSDYNLDMTLDREHKIEDHSSLKYDSGMAYAREHKTKARKSQAVLAVFEENTEYSRDHTSSSNDEERDRSTSQSNLAFVFGILWIVVLLAVIACVCVRKAKSSSQDAQTTSAEERKANFVRKAHSKGFNDVGVGYGVDKVPEEPSNVSQVPDVPETLSTEEFQIVDIQGKCNSYRWVSSEEATNLGLAVEDTPREWGEHARHASADGGAVDLIPAPWSPETVIKVLTENGVSTHAWTDDKVDALAEELVKGKAFLIRTGNQLKRMMQLVQVIVVHPISGHAIVADTKTSFGRKHTTSESTLSIRKAPLETISETSERCVREKLNVPDGAIEIATSRVKSTETDELSDFYPGLTTVVCRHIVQAKVVTEDEYVLRCILADEVTQNSFETDYKGQLCRWSWRSLEDVPALRQHRQWILEGRSSPRMTSARGSPRMTPPVFSGSPGMLSPSASPGATPRSSDSRVSSPRQAAFGKVRSMAPNRRRSMISMRDGGLSVIMPWHESEVKTLLEAFETAPEAFGISLAELSAQASQGLLAFGQTKADGRLVAIHDRILLRVHSAKGTGMLVQTNAADASGPSWPEATWRLDEGAWEAARRLARTHLCIQDDALVIGAHQKVRMLTDELPGASSTLLNRRWLISAQLAEGMGHLLGSAHAPPRAAA